MFEPTLHECNKSYSLEIINYINVSPAQPEHSWRALPAITAHARERKALQYSCQFIEQLFTEHLYKKAYQPRFAADVVSMMGTIEDYGLSRLGKVKLRDNSI